MSIPATAIWEVRTTGIDTNGGFFNPVRSGTDYSQQDAPQLSLTDVFANVGTLTSVTGGFTAGMVGNGIYLLDGSNEYWCEITGFTDTNTITVSSTLYSSPVTVHIGGGLATPQQSAQLNQPDNIIYIKASGSIPDYVINTYTGSSWNGNGAVLGFNDRVKVIGYTSTHSDGTLGCVTIQNGTNSAPWTVLISGNNVVLENLTLDCNKKGNSLYAFYSGNLAIYCVAKNFAAIAFSVNTRGCVADNSGYISRTGQAFSNWFHSNSVAKHCDSGIIQPFGATKCVIIDCREGVTTSTNSLITHCTAYACGTGFILGSQVSYVADSLAVNCTGDGFRDGGYAGSFINCKGYGNASDTLSSALIADVVNLGSDPLTNGAGGDFSIVVGSAARGISSIFPNLSTTDYSDIGAVQHQDSGDSPVTTSYSF